MQFLAQPGFNDLSQRYNLKVRTIILNTGNICPDYSVNVMKEENIAFFHQICQLDATFGIIIASWN
jgi:hypothetical protein